MSFALTFKQVGGGALVGKIAGAATRAGDLSDGWDDVSERFHELERRQFLTEGGLTGGWESLDPDYAAQKGRGSILVRSGNLRDALTDPTHPDAVEKKEDDRYVRSLSGEAAEVAGFHAAGTEDMPEREPMIPGEMIAGDAANSVLDHIMEAFR